MKTTNFILVLLGVFFLSACSNGNEISELNYAPEAYSNIRIENAMRESQDDETEEPQTQEPDEQPRTVELTFTQPRLELKIDLATDELLATFDYIHEIDYTLLRRVRSGDNTIEAQGDTGLVIWANVPLYDFALIWTGNDEIEHRPIFIPAEESFGEVSEFLPKQAFVINHYFAGQNWTPWSGVRFTDYNGEVRHFAIRRHFAYPYHREGRWVVEEFEDRTDKLPTDWEPWWVGVDLNPRVEVISKPCEELRTHLLEESGISEYGWSVAADFLSGFDSLFIRMGFSSWQWNETERRAEHTGLYHTWFESVEERPEIVFVERFSGEDYEPGFYDREGNVITDVPWIIRSHYAGYFNLFDFDNSGIPDIIVHFNQTFEGCYGGFYRIFRYINGEYRMLEILSFSSDGEQLPWVNFGTVHELFTDIDGRIITFVDSTLSGMDYEHLIFVNNRIELHSIMTYVSDWNAWQDHHWQIWRPTPYIDQRILIDCWTHHNPTIFNTDIPITPLHPFTDLGEEMLAYLRYIRQ